MSDIEYPLIPPELLQYTLLQESLSDRINEPDSLLRFLTKPGHLYGEGYRRVYLGLHPDDDLEYVGPADKGIEPASTSNETSNNDETDTAFGSRSFLIGVQTLWELDKHEKGRQKLKGKQRQRAESFSSHAHAHANGNLAPPPDTHQAASTLSPQQRFDSDSVAESSTSNRSDSHSTPATEATSVDDFATPATGFESARRSFLWSRSRRASDDKPMSTKPSLSEAPSKPSQTSSRDIQSPDDLFSQFDSKDRRKHLSSGNSDMTAPPGTDRKENAKPKHVPQDVLSRRALDSPAIIGDVPAIADLSARAPSFIDSHGQRNANRPISDETRARVREILAFDAEPESEPKHELLRRISDTLVPETASDTFVISSTERHPLGENVNIDDKEDSKPRPDLSRLKSTKSVRWDTSQGGNLIPGPRRSTLQAFASGSGDKPAASPSQVLARPDKLEHPAEETPDDIPSPAQLSRSETPDSAKELARLSEVKAASLPPGVEKLERMLVRACWTKSTMFPPDFDELAARKYTLNWTPWEEMAVIWKRHHVEIYGTHRDPYHRYLTRDLALRYIIPLGEGSQTSLSLFSVADQMFCLRCPPVALGGRHVTGKAGLKNKRHLNKEGTNIFLFRARATSIAQDWYLGLHIALKKERLENLEVYLPGLGLRMRLPTNAAAHDTVSASESVSGARNLMTGGLSEGNLVSKEEMLQSCKDLISGRRDWKELLDNIEGRGLQLRLAWRKGSILEWLTFDRSIDGIRRIWDVYTGAIMKQRGTEVHRLEVLPETHYPNLVQIAPRLHLVEPPAIEGFISRLRHRNENTREKLYLGTFRGILVIFKATKVKPPRFPKVSSMMVHDDPPLQANDEEEDNGPENASPLDAPGKHDNRTEQVMKEHYRAENARLSTMMLQCKGAIRLRDINAVELDDSCQHCRGKSEQAAEKMHASGKSGDHEHSIVQLKLGDDREFRFETTPKEAAREWVGRLTSLVEYWTKREQSDASVQLSLSSYTCVKASAKTPLEDLPPFQQREAEDDSTQTSVYNPLLAQAFHYCIQLGCHYNILMQGRLYYKKNHRDGILLDRFIILLDNNLIIFETVRRNIQKRPIPLVYHRRLKTIRLRDVYLVTGDSCAPYFRQTFQTDFNPSQDQNSLARVYKDGLVAVDDPMDCTFMLWRQRPSGTMSQLGRNGAAHLFRARSRLERDQWVQALNVMCEAYGRTNREREVRLATFSHIK